VLISLSVGMLLRGKGGGLSTVRDPERRVLENFRSGGNSLGHSGSFDTRSLGVGGSPSWRVTMKVEYIGETKRGSEKKKALFSVEGGRQSK